MTKTVTIYQCDFCGKVTDHLNYQINDQYQLSMASYNIELCDDCKEIVKKEDRNNDKDSNNLSV